jgi:hypothetical protein
MQQRLPAKSIDDFRLNEETYKVDFELSARMEAFATELERLSLLGIGLYGFLLSNFMFDKGQPTHFFVLVSPHHRLLGIGVIAFAVSAGCALISNFLSTKCLGCQVDIVRMFNRIDSARWDEKEQQVNRNFAKNRQLAQRRVLICSRTLLLISTLSLVPGAIFVALTFAQVLFRSVGNYT